MSKISAGSFFIIMILFVVVSACSVKACLNPFFEHVGSPDTCPTHKDYHYDLNHHLDEVADKNDQGGFKDWDPHKMPDEDKGTKRALRRKD